MVDLDPSIWENPTLGSAVNLPFLDEVSLQTIENSDARREGREPRDMQHRSRYTDETRNGSLIDLVRSNFEKLEIETNYERTRIEEAERVETSKRANETLQENKETTDKIPVIPEQEEKEPVKKTTSRSPSGK